MVGAGKDDPNQGGLDEIEGLGGTLKGHIMMYVTEAIYARADKSDCW